MLEEETQPLSIPMALPLVWTHDDGNIQSNKETSWLV